MIKLLTGSSGSKSLFALLLCVLLIVDHLKEADACRCQNATTVNNGKGKGSTIVHVANECRFDQNGKGNAVCLNGYGNWGVCVPMSGCPEAGTVPVPLPLNINKTIIHNKFVDPVPTWSYIYECQNATLFLAVFNVSISAWGYMLDPRNTWVNTATCITAVPAFHRGAQVFDVGTYNSCDHAGGCGRCGGCNCTCRVDDPWYWQCCMDPCFGCSACCGCRGNFVGGDWWNGDDSCLQCNQDGWCGYPNGQMYTPTVCQFALAAINPNNRLDYESLVDSNFTYQVRIVQRTIGCSACNSLAMVNFTIYVKDCNEWPIFDNAGIGMSIYQYEGLSGVFYGTAFNILVRDLDVFTTSYNTFDLNVEFVTLNGVSVTPAPWYITNPHAIGTNMNRSQLMYDASRCGVQTQQCLDFFRYAYTGAAVPIFRIRIIAVDGGGAISTATYSVTILNTPETPMWVNLPATVNVIEGTTGSLQIYPMEAVVPRFVAAVNTVQFKIIQVTPDVVAGSALSYIGNGACVPAGPSATQCNGLYLTVNVGAGTLVYATQKTYNVSVWLTNKISTSTLIYTISSSIIVNILQRIYQPILSPGSDTAFVFENVTDPACIYNITGVTSPNSGRVFFVYSVASVTPGNSAFYLNGTAICYDGTRQQVGPSPGWIFNARLAGMPYLVRIAISDPGSVLPIPTFTLTVSIMDVEDPIILSVPAYQIIQETATAWTFIVSATKETNQPAVTFALQGQSQAANNLMWNILTQSSTFASGAATANVIANPAIVLPPMFNWTVAPIIYLNVTAYTAKQSVTSLITFYIQRVNTAPFFSNLPNMTFVSEQITGYVTIFSLTTGDREEDTRQVFFRNPTTGALGPYDPSGKFYIDPILNIITVNLPAASTFNYYTQPTYSLTCCVVDYPPFGYTSATSTSTFVVQIARNQTAPTWVTPPPTTGTTLSPNIKENVKGQADLFTLTATDRESDTIYYNITDVRPLWNTAFRLRQNVVEYNESFATMKPMFNNSLHPVYYIVLECSDMKTNPTSTTTLTVSIDRVDLPAQFTSLPCVVTVREDVYWGPTDVITVGAIDPNKKYAVTINYVTVTPSSGANKIYYTSATRAIGYNLNPQFSYGVVNSYRLQFTAFNTILPTVTSYCVIQIIPVAQGPQANKTGTVYLHENTTTAQTLWDLRARDNNSLTLRYSLNDMVPQAYDKFSVTNQGLIKSNDNPKFNYQQASSYLIYAAFQNAAGQAATFTLTVSIIDDPEPPIITNLPSLTNLKETVTGPLGGGLFYTKCTDEDSRALSWSYAVLPSTGQTFFNISSSGVISTTPTAKFSYNAQPYYYVVAFCSNGYYTATGTLTVIISWSTTTSTTTPKPRTTRPDAVETTTTTIEGDLLTPEQIGAIVGSLLGALALAGAAWGIARYLQNRAKAEGLVGNMKKVPTHQYRNYKM